MKYVVKQRTIVCLLKAQLQGGVKLFVCLLAVCSFVVHDRCLKTVVSSCASLAALSIAVSKT